MRWFFLFIILLLGSPIIAQEKAKLLLEVNSLPLKKGFIYEKQEPRLGSCGLGWCDGIKIIMASDSVYSVSDGIVASVFDLGNTWAVVVKGKGDIFYMYANLKMPDLRKGDSIAMAQFLATVDEVGVKYLTFLIADKTIYHDQYRTVEFLKSIQIRCDIDKLLINKL